MNYLPKTAYWGPLLPNAGSVENKTNSCAPYFTGNEAEFVLVLKTNILQYPCVHNSFQKYEEVCE